LEEVTISHGWIIVARACRVFKTGAPGANKMAQASHLRLFFAAVPVESAAGREGR